MNKIAELRKKQGWSQSELASYVGVKQNTISQYENDQRNIPSRLVLKFADLFGVSPSYLMGEAEKPDEIHPVVHDLQLATKIITEEIIDKVNLYLRKGWRLVHIGDDREFREDGSGYSTIIYTLAWFGHPQHPSAEELPEDTSRIYGWHEEGLDGI
jgi:transcriptional regulator with XRE-family HTH domain|nr:helix-turn-helix transcriptional regulator [uncultured Oscillibacter sp.]